MFDEAGWVNKIITAGIIAMIGWTLLTVQNVSVELAVLKTKLDGVEQAINLSQVDRYTRSEAVADKALVQQQIQSLETLLERNSERIRDLERHGSAGQTPNR